MATVQWPCTTLGGLGPCLELGCRGGSSRVFLKEYQAPSLVLGLLGFCDVHLLYQADIKVIQDAGPGLCSEQAGLAAFSLAF